MYLRELRLHGFKSFADPTRLEFKRGTTAIVGPNGCGKSNIADAIRWVLGEQSAKSLRAGAMQDVIFQGTTSRKPVNLCEVTLVFSECEAQLGTAFAEVEVTRRVLRDGGSDYYLNGKQCRLRDIQRLFLDTGVGQVSYSFMLQGQIDQVLSNNPSERRAIFEEAAGISKYKAQRREALTKLTHVDANLARVTDVMEEVSRQIGSLKRQAAKALRFKRIKHRLTHLDLAYGSRRYSLLKGEIGEMEQKAQVLRQHVEKLEKELNDAEAGLSGKRGRRNELNNRLQQWQQAVFELRSEKENAQNKAEYSQLRQEDLGRRIEEIEQELAELENQRKLLSERLAGESKVKQEQMDLFGNSDEVFQSKSAELAEIQQQLSHAELEVSRGRQALLMKESSVTRLRSNCTTLEVDLKTYQVRHANLTEEIHLLREEFQMLEQESQQLERTHTARLKEKEQQTARIEEYRQTSQSLLEEFRELQKRIQETDRRIAGIQARVGVLEGLQARFEGFSDGAKAILQGKLEGTIDNTAYSLFLKNLQIQPGYTHGLETLLGAAADGLYFKEIRRVSPVAQKLRDDHLGRATLFFEVPGKSNESRKQELPGSMVAAASVVSSGDERIQRFLQPYLNGCYFVDTLENFLTFWQENPEFRFHYAVTDDNDLIDSRGVVFAGSRKGQKEDSSFLDRENQIRQFKAELVSLQDQQESQRMQADQLQGKMDSLEKKTDDQRRLVAELSQEVTTLSTQHQNSQKNVEQNQRQLLVKEAELEKQELSREESLARLEKANTELAAMEKDIEDQKQKIRDCEAAVEAVREARENHRESFNEVRLQMAEKKQRLEMLDRTLEELEKQSREVETTRLRRDQELSQLRSQIAGLGEEVHVQREKMGEIEERMASVMQELEKDRVALKEIEREIEVVEQGFASRRETHDKCSRELNQVDVQLARKQSQLQFIVEELQREYEVQPATIDWKKELWEAGDTLPDRIKVDIEDESPDDFEVTQPRGEATEEDLAELESTDWSAVQEEVESLRTRINTMGPVNLVAIEEYKELRDRHEFLKTQSEDLWNSKDQLMQAIDEINTTSKELFALTFDQIRNNFKYTFDTLFGGGTSDLVLVDTDDVLESGIDITARPPGTRLGSLALLSGGQKTMTAVALLFAIYMVKPSPFCVLDEIDAPLDDANIGRFTKMLETFLEYSQFLIITHNKRTIGVADTIYGATMQEKGVSRIVSMRFNKNTGKAEEAPVG